MIGDSYVLIAILLFAFQLFCFSLFFFLCFLHCSLMVFFSGILASLSLYFLCIHCRIFDLWLPRHSYVLTYNRESLF